jgi:transposase
VGTLTANLAAAEREQGRTSLDIPRRSNEKHKGKFDKEANKQRNRVERFFNRLKQFRRIATRYEKRVANYKAMLTLAAILFWL